MAFTVTPTSGAGPYSFQAVVENSMWINGVDYVAAVRSSTQPDTCPVEGLSSPLSSANVEKLVNGQIVTTNAPDVPEGSCRTSTLTITRVFDDVVIASSSVSIDNL